MTIPGLSLPALSEYDPKAAGEGSLDPMGLAALSDRLADQLAPGLRNRMIRPRFVTALTVGALAYEGLETLEQGDGISTPSICFEWIVIEAMVRRLGAVPFGVPGSQKARMVVQTKQRLSAPTYLKGPSVFGFNGVYKPFAVDAGLIDDEFAPDPRSGQLARAWELEQGFPGYTDAISGSEGGRFRVQIRDQVARALRAGRCETNPQSHLFGKLSECLHPEEAGPSERRVLRALVLDERWPIRAELAAIMLAIGDHELTEEDALRRVRPQASRVLRRIIDAVIAYEDLSRSLDNAFRTLCVASYAQGATPLTPDQVRDNDIIARCARELPDLLRVAVDAVSAIDPTSTLYDRMSAFTAPHSPPDLAVLLMDHHEAVQANKGPNGKRPWFEPVRNGWIVRSQYGNPEPRALEGTWVHPVRVAAVRRFLEASAP